MHAHNAHTAHPHIRTYAHTHPLVPVCVSRLCVCISGRILNKFGADVDQIDIQLPEALDSLLTLLFFTIVSIISIAIILPWFLIALVVVLLGCVCPYLPIAIPSYLPIATGLACKMRATLPALLHMLFYSSRTAWLATITLWTCIGVVAFVCFAFFFVVAAIPK